MDRHRIRSALNRIPPTCLVALWLLISCFHPSKAHAGSPTFHSTRFQNGLRLLVIQDSTQALVKIELLFGVGSSQDPVGKEGLAHLLEHLLADEWNSDLELQARHELLVLYRNATTNLTRMTCLTWCLPKDLAEILQLEAQRITDFDPAPEIFERERFVVRQERLLRDTIHPRVDLQRATLQASFRDHLFGRPIVGTDSSLARIELKDIADFHESYVCTQNLLVVLNGPLDPHHARQLVGASYGLIPASDRFRVAEIPPPPPRKRTTVQLERQDHENFHACVGFRLPASTPREILLGLLATQMLRGPRTQESLMYLPWELYWTLGFGWLYSKNPDRADTNSMQARAWSEIWERLKQRVSICSRPDSFEVRRDRAIRHLVDSRSLLERVDPGVFFDDTSWYSMRDSLLRSFTRDDFMALVDTFLVSENSSAGIAHGSGSRRRVQFDLQGMARQSSWSRPVSRLVDTAPSAQIDTMLQSLATRCCGSIEHRVLRNGIPVVLLPHSGVPRVRIGGARTFQTPKQARKKPGLMCAYRTIVSSDPGIRARSWQALPYQVDFSVDSQSMTFGGIAQPQEVAELCEVVTERMKEQEFNVRSWNLVRDYPDAFVSPRHYSKDIVARVNRWSWLLGDEHPVLGEWRGDPRKVEDWKYSHLGDVHKEVMRSGDLHLVATGPFDPDEIMGTLNDTFGQLDGFGPRKERVHSPSACDAPSVTVISAFDRRDCRIVFTMQPVPQTQTLGWAEMEVLRTTIQRRIFRRLRFREGLSYTVQTGFERANDDLIVEVYVSTFPNATKRVIESTIEELSRMARDGVSRENFHAAQLTAAKRLVREMHDPVDAFYRLRSLALFGDLPDSPLDAILETSYEKCAALARQAIDPNRFVVSVCGPILEEDEDQLRPLLTSP